MDNIQFIQTTPQALANLIADNVREQLLNFRTELEKKASQNTGKELLTRKETSEYFDVSLVTIHDWSKSGILKPYKVGNRTYFKRSEIMEVVNQSNN
jgi:hypothetical protein